MFSTAEVRNVFYFEGFVVKNTCMHIYKPITQLKSSVFSQKQPDVEKSSEFRVPEHIRLAVVVTGVRATCYK